jgi:hypothetical protein
MLKTYESLRKNHIAAEGLTADQIRSVHVSGTDPYWYAQGIVAGFSHLQMCQADAAGMDLFDYVQARRGDLGHDWTIAAHRAGINSYFHQRARQSEDSDRRVRAALRAGIDLWRYTCALKAGITDRQIRSVHARGFSVRVYTELRSVATDAEARDAIDLLGDRITDYLYLRGMGHRHRSALNMCADLPF